MRRTRSWAPVLAAGVTVAVLMGAVSYAVRTNPTTTVAALPGATRLDYAADPPGSLTPLSPDFVAQSLGLSFPATGAPGATASPISAGKAPQGAGARTAVNPVTTPTYHCVNGHQTEDPLSPPCVAQFNGDNGGATYEGVTGDEVRVLVTLGLSDAPSVLRHPSSGHYFDLEAPPSADETANMPWLQRLRSLQGYFNQHYQTYGRRVHLWATGFSGGGVEAIRAEARLDAIVVRPFAVLVVPWLQTIESDYTAELASRGVATFTMSLDTADDASFASHPGLSWGYRPGAKEAADLYGSYLCQKVVRRPVTMSGNPAENGGPRRLGLLEIADQPEVGTFISLVRQRVEGCGGTIVDTERYHEPNGCATQVEDEAGGGTGTDDTKAMAGFKAHRVTTVIWPACVGYRMGRSASALGYLPEWVLWGSGSLDKNLWASANSSPAGAWDGHAVVVTPATFRPDIPQRLCYRAMLAEDPRTPTDDVTDTACDYYEGLRQVFTALQLAGPYLAPTTMDRGIRELKPVAASDPQTPRCAYPTGDYTCVKDAQAEWWDSQGGGDPTPSVLGVRALGCWRAMEGGRRYTAGQWPQGNVDAQRRGDDPCNLFGAHDVPTAS